MKTVPLMLFSLIVYDLIRLQICKVCQKEFANVYRLQRHMISHDESAVLRRFKCADCGKAFKFKHHLKVWKLIQKEWGVTKNPNLEINHCHCYIEPE